MYISGAHGATVYYILPIYGSVNGETRLTLHGVGK
jgi:hypothetical protein